MFTVLNKLKYNIKQDIKRVEEVWDSNPDNDYYFAEICGLKRALEHVDRAYGSELNDLDKWAQEYNKGKERDGLTIRNRARS